MLQLSRWGGNSPVGKAKGVLPSAGFAFAPRLGLVCNVATAPPVPCKSTLGCPGPVAAGEGWPGRAGPRPRCLVCVITRHRSELGRSNNNKLFWYLRGNCT